MSEVQETVTKAQLAEVFDVSLPTIDTWIRKGCPFVESGGNGKPWSFRINEVAAWRERMARSSMQNWKGGHVSTRGQSPELTALFAHRPDLENGLRFFIESAFAGFMKEWATNYSMTYLGFLYEKGASRERASSEVQAATNFLFVAVAEWFIRDRFNKSLQPRESLDGIWHEIFGMSKVKSSPPEYRDQVLTQAESPDWCEMEFQDLVAHFGPVFDEIDQKREASSEPEVNQNG